MKKILVSAIIIVAFVGYFWFQQQSLLAIDIIPNVSATPTKTPTPTTVSTVGGTGLPATTSKPTTNSTPVPTPRPTPIPTPQVSGFRNGTYTSQVGDAGYGPVQFKVVVQGGKITDIQFLQYPSDRSQSLQRSNYALPILRQEAITAQSANIDIVSQATATSDAFIQVLGSLLSGPKV